LAIAPRYDCSFGPDEADRCIHEVPEGYVAFIEELTGANKQGETLEEAREFERSSRCGFGGEPRVI
jgi:hypothetical protein